MWRLASILFALVCAACASPSSKQAAEFGKVATASIAIVADSRVAEIDLIRESEIEERTYKFLSQGVVSLYPPLDGKGVKLLNEQADLLAAVSRYTQALSEATDPQSISNLEAAASSLSGATTAFLGKIPSSTTSPLIGPAINLISTVAVDVVELETSARLRAVIQETDPHLQTAAIKILEDWTKVEDTLRRAKSKWVAEKTKNLKLLLRDPQIANGNLYVIYKDSDNTARQFKQRLSVLSKKKIVDVLDKLLTAHYALLSNDVDFQAAYVKLKAIVAELQAIRSAIAPTKQGND